MTTTFSSQPEMWFEAPVPVPDVKDAHFFALCTAAGRSGVQITLATAAEIDRGTRAAVAAQLHTWFELDSATTAVDEYFYSTATTALQHAINIALTTPGVPAQRLRWNLVGLVFNEADGHFTYRIEPDTERKLKLRQPESKEASVAPLAAAAPPLPSTTTKYRAGTPAVRRGQQQQKNDDLLAEPSNDDVLALAASEVEAEEYLREYTAAIEQARRIRMDASRRFIEKMGIADSGSGTIFEDE